jgi:hypothetical protein
MVIAIATQAFAISTHVFAIATRAFATATRGSYFQNFSAASRNTVPDAAVGKLSCGSLRSSRPKLIRGEWKTSQCMFHNILMP